MDIRAVAPNHRSIGASIEKVGDVYHVDVAGRLILFRRDLNSALDSMFYEIRHFLLNNQT